MAATHQKPLVNRLRPLLLLLFVALATVAADAQFSLQQVAFPGGTALDISQYPLIRARVRAVDAGQPVQLDGTNVFIIQGNQIVPPDRVLPESDGVHVVEWTTSQFGFISVNMIAYHDGQTADSRFSRTVPRDKGARVVIRDSLSRIVPYFLDFGAVASGGSDTLKLKVLATEAAFDEEGEERRILLESIEVDNPAFKINWKGSFGSAPPPINILSPLQYRFDLICEPTNNDPLSAVLTVKFEGGMRTDIMISANPSSYPRETILRLNSPNGGESFAPCQEIPIDWSGMVSGFYAFLEYSVDNGRTWSFIDSTLDSNYLWEIPETFTDSGRVRVFQKFQSSEKDWLAGEDAPVTNATYSADGRYLLLAYSNGVINEWDVAQLNRVNSYNVGTSIPVGALAYRGRSRDFFAVTTRQGSKGGTIHEFVAGTPGATATAQVPSDIEVRDLGTDADGTTLFILPQLSGRIVRFNAVSLTPLPGIQLGSAISTSSISGSLITASLMNGEVVSVDASTAQETDRSQTGLVDARGPIPYRAAGSMNGRLVALAGKQLTGVLNAPKEQRTFIYDMQAGRIVKILYREGSDAVNLTFSPSNAFLALGFQFNPQFVVYDLLQARTLPPEGSAEGHSNRLTDLAFSPDGSTIVSTSIDSSNNALIRRVSNPESDMSDGVFSISPVQLDDDVIVLRPLLIGTTNDTLIGAEVCNTGSVPAIVDVARFETGQFLRFNRSPQGDTVLPGECLQLEISATPLDTGLLSDTLILTFCGSEIRIPFEQRSIDRDLALLVEIEDFGDVCVGETSTRQIAMIRNNDSVAVTINSVFVEGGLQAQFRVVQAIEDTLLPPGGVLELEVQFQPRELGQDTSNVIIRYADQRVLTRIVKVSGSRIWCRHSAVAPSVAIHSRDPGTGVGDQEQFRESSHH